MNVTYNLTYNITFTAVSQPEADVINRLRNFLTSPHQILAVVLALVAILLNLLSLLAICRVHHRVTSHFLFIISLALSDIIIGVSVLLYLVNKVLHQSYPAGQGPWQERLTFRCMFVFIKSLNSTGLNITLLNLIGMALDHYVAITRPLHCQSLMTRSRVAGGLVGAWAVAVLCGFSDFFTGLKYLKLLPSGTSARTSKFELNYCEVVWLTRYQEEYVTFVLAFICLVVLSFMYKRIYDTVQSRERPSHPHAETDPHRRDRKALVTTLLIVGTFILCWLPMCLFQIILIAVVKLSPGTLNSMKTSLRYADQFLYDLLLLNCICDPIVYAVRMTEIRSGYRRLCCGGRHISSLSSPRTDSITHHTRASLLKRQSKDGTKNGATISIPGMTAESQL